MFRAPDGACLGCGAPATTFTDALAGYVTEYVARPARDTGVGIRDRPLAEVVSERGVEYAPAAAEAIAPTPVLSSTVPKKRGASDYVSSSERARIQAQAKQDAAAALMSTLEQMIQQPETAMALMRQLEAAAAHASFAEFFRQAWKVIEPSTDLVWNWHLTLMCTVAQAVFMDWLKTKTEKKHINRVRNVIFNVPPGSSKSAVFARCFQAWCWLHWPGMKVIALSVNEGATMRDARAMRELIKSSWYQESFKPEWTVKEDQDAVSSFGNTKSGDRLSMPMKSEIVGLRADCFRKGTLVPTEIGDVSIDELHVLAERNERVPRVYSFNHDTGQIELRAIEATRRILSRRTVDVRVADVTLQCTHAHRFFSEGDYTQAAHLSGCHVPVVCSPHGTFPLREGCTLPGMSLRDSGMSALPDDVSTTRGGVRQESRPGCDGRALLFESLQDVPHASTAGDAVVCDLRVALQEGLPQTRQPVLLLEEVCRNATQKPYTGTHEQVSALRRGVRLQNSSAVLHSTLRVQRSRSHGEHERAVRDLLAQAISHHSRARRLEMYCLRCGAHTLRDRVSGTPHQPRSASQCAGKPGHAMHVVSRHTPQGEQHETPVLSHHTATVDDRGDSHDVYDIQVEGLHNFFAGDVHGYVLVHNCILIDDPNNPKRSESKDERDTINDLWDTNQYNRVNDVLRSIRIGIQQRTHAADWTGHALHTQGTWSDKNPNGWLHVVLPAEFDPERKFELPEPLAAIVRQHLPDSEVLTADPRQEKGEALDKVRAPEDFLLSEKERWRGTGNYAGQMDQRPSMAEGEMVQRGWFNFFRLARGVREDEKEFSGIDEHDGKRPRARGCHEGDAQVVRKASWRDSWDFDWVTISIDPAAKKTDKGSNYGLIVVAGKEGRRYVLDDRTQRGAFHQIIDIIKEMVRIWRPDTILIEPKAAGPDIMDTLQEQMKKGDIPMVYIEEAEPGNSDKEARLEAALPYVKNGAVYLLDGASWLDEFVEELAQYPNGLRDDRVDALSQVLNKKRDAVDHWPTMS